jgi:hypothetical protein
MWFTTLQSEERFALIGICVAAFVLIACFVMGMIYGMHKNRLEDSLKRELLERGMSADEIATVMNKTPQRISRKSTQV